jgi:hypothetical protein
MRLASYLQELQPLLLALILVGASAVKLLRALRARSLHAAQGASVLFPPKLRRLATLLLCATELVLGAALVLTSVRYRLLDSRAADAAARHSARWAANASGEAAEAARAAAQVARAASNSAELAADSVRFSAAVFFLVGMFALVELRERHPGTGCGCLGDLSREPPGVRSILRAGMLAGVSLAGIDAPPLSPSAAGAVATTVAALLLTEILMLAAVSPEVGHVLARMGYAEPCEARVIPPARILAALHRSAAWSRHAALAGGSAPADMWRELCWWYLVYPACQDGRPCELVFAVEMKSHRPRVLAAVVDPESLDPESPDPDDLDGPADPPFVLPAPVPSAVF